MAARKLITAREVRLVTLTGAGGSGKTRLGVELARDLVEQFEAVYFVELETLREPSLIVATIARAIGIHEAGARPLEARLKDHLRERRALLILDNFEQVVATAPFVTELLTSCPLLKVLVTSRMPLYVRGEFEFGVPPLEVPDSGATAEARYLAQNAAVRLFAERARAVKPEFSVTEENASTLAEICRRLDGLPLAIELVAARVRMLSPAAILERLDQKLALLQGGARDLPERQQTIRNAIAWSYDLLEAEEARLFSQLAVFAGGWTLEAVEDVCAGDAEMPLANVLEALVNKNLLRAHHTPEGELRFTMLETIREYASELLSDSGEAAELLTRHAAFYVQLAEAAEPHLTSGRRDLWLMGLQTELDNLRAVLGRSIKRRVDPRYGIRLAGTLGWFWHLRGHLTEGRNWVTALLALPEAAIRGRARGKLLFPAGGLAWSQGDYQAAIEYLEESASILEDVGDLRGLTDARGILAGSLAGVGEYDRAQALCEKMEARLREAEDQWGVAFTLYWLGGSVLARTGNAASARRIFEEILPISEDLADSWLRAEALDHLGVVTGMHGDYEAAQTYFEQSLAYHQAIGDDWAIARVLSEHGEAALQAGDLATAEELFRESLRLWWDMGNTLGVLACLGGLARVATDSWQAARAACLFGATPQLVRTVGWLFLRADAEEYEQHQAAAQQMLAKNTWREAYEKGRAMTHGEAVRYAVSAGGHSFPVEVARRHEAGAELSGPTDSKRLLG